MDFESYLISKRIDGARFKTAEPELWQSWKTDFDQMHPNSFTIQNLNLINPIRRKYTLTVIETPKAPPPSAGKTPSSGVVKPAIKVARPGLATRPTTSSDADDTAPEVKGASEPVDRAVINESRNDHHSADSTTAQPASNTENEIKDGSGISKDEKVIAEAPKPEVKPAKPVVPRPVMKPKPKTN